MSEVYKLKRAPAGSSKKWQVTVPGKGGRTKTVKFGARGYQDYTQHRDKQRRENYRSRHRGDNIDDPTSPGFWSWWVLWGDTPDRGKAFASAVRRAKKLMPRSNPLEPGPGKRPNPLLARPPAPSDGLHRMGSVAASRVQGFFEDVDDNVKDLYEGVHVSPHPIVATAYAMGRREIDYNDYGVVDITDPPVLIGFNLDGEEVLDADGYTVAMNLDKTALEIVDDVTTSEGAIDDEVFEELSPDIGDDFTWGQHWSFEPYFGIGYAGGMFGNLPSYDAFLSALRGHVEAIASGVFSREEILQQALRRSYDIVPQSRILRDLTEREVAAVVVLAPYVPAEESKHADEMVAPPFEGLEAFEGMEEPSEFDDQILSDSTVVYGDVSMVNRWHGTSLSLARKALPGIFTPALVQRALEAGSAYDLEELGQDLD